MRKYSHFLAEKSIRDLPEFADVAARHSTLEWIDDYQTFSVTPASRRACEPDASRAQNLAGSGRYNQEKDCVIFARKRGPWLKPFHCYENSAYRFLSLDLAEGCLFDCVYCYLQSYLNHGALVLFLGLTGLLEELNALDQGAYWISTGLLSDSLLAESQFPFLTRISKNLPPNAILELRSKAADVTMLESADIARKQIVLSWSLNPPEIARNYEFGASSVAERLTAAWQAIHLGYRVAFHLDPVFCFDGWQQAYAELFSMLENFPKRDVAFLSVGLFRYMPDLGAVIRKRFPYHPILSGEFFPDEDGKYHYFRAIRKEMYESFSGWLKRWEDIPVFRSMEPDPRLFGGNRT